MEIDFNKTGGLVPVIIQDEQTLEVLMLGYMNQDAYDKTAQENIVTFFSRTKNRLWTKGETSGNYLFVIDIVIDCDNDCLLVKVDPAGPACHTGADTCFNEINEPVSFLSTLEAVITQRKNSELKDSYVSGLFKKGINKIAQKVGEEAVELVIEAKDNDENLLKNEAADLLFHYLILLQAKGLKLSDIEEVLKQRHK